MTKASLIREFLFFLRNEKKWWIIPLVVLLVMTGGVLIVGSHPTVAPLLYPAQ